MSGERPVPMPLAPDLAAKGQGPEGIDGADTDELALDTDAAPTAPAPSPQKPSAVSDSGAPPSGRVPTDTTARRAARPRMTLKIPDDEVARPQSTPSTPPAKPVSDSAPDAGAVTATRIITIEPPAPSSSPPPPIAIPKAPPRPSSPASASPSQPAPGTTSVREDSWTPYQPTVADVAPVARTSSIPAAPALPTTLPVPPPAPTVPAAPSTAPGLAAPTVDAAAKRSDSIDDIVIDTDVPESGEPVDVEDVAPLVAPVAPMPPVAPVPAIAPPPGISPAPSVPPIAAAAPSPSGAAAQGAAPAAASSSSGIAAHAGSPTVSIATSPSAPPSTSTATTVVPTGMSVPPTLSVPVPPAAAAPTVATPSTPVAPPRPPLASPATPQAAFVPPAPAPSPAVSVKGLPPMRGLAPTEPEGFDVQFDEGAPLAPAGPRKSEPAEAEIAPEDLVSVESVPSPSQPKGRPGAKRPQSLPPPPAPAKVSARQARMIMPSPGSSPLAPPPMSEAAPTGRRKARPWWEELFNDDFIRTMAKITDAQIAAEATFIEDSLAVAKGAMVLDLACGTGRHAIELTRRGYKVVGFDLSLPMLAKAAEEAQERAQKLNFVQGDMREMTFEDTFDGIYCWNTSFGFFEEEKNCQVVARVHKALRKGGQFLLDVVNRDYIIRQAPSLAWFEGDGCICMDEMSIDWITSRMKVKRTMMMDDGRTKEIEYSVRVYSLHELGKVLHDAGFRVAEVSGRASTPGVFFGNESPRTLILAEKR